MNNLEHKNLEELRQLIDDADNKILDAIKERFEIIKLVGQYKRKNNIPPLQPWRWEQVLNDKIEKAKQRQLDEDMIKDIWNAMHKWALKIEAEIMKE